MYLTVLKKHSTRENQVILLMITDGEKWHYVAVKSLSALLRGITSKYKEDFYCVNCFQAYTTKNKLKNICRNGRRRQQNIKILS